ncbi:unnamed protein product [Lactuca virosa]|uniref:Oleosin n=1 Tax=Lactuca virosa TaxID=75947 RepID=A0AAU9PTV5_9ASTR|nr:unnamed protein product [Lactuca virosa]
MAENGTDQQQSPFDETLAKTLKFLPIIALSDGDPVWLVISFVVVLVFNLLIPVLIIIIPVLIILSPVFIILVFILLIPVLIYRYVTGKHPIWGDHVDEVRKKIVEAVEKLGKEVKDKMEELVANLGGGGGGSIGRD